MNQLDVQKAVKKEYGNIPDCVKEYESVEKCVFYADKLSFEGYGQTSGGYYGHKGVDNPTQNFNPVEQNQYSERAKDYE